MLLGIDEVGRGAWAGPLVMAAVSLGGADITGLTDSKLLTRPQRESLFTQIQHAAQAISVAWVDAAAIDQRGLSWALKYAAQSCLDQIQHHSVSSIIIDGTIKFIDDPRVSTQAKADLTIPSVSAASVIAKVLRDRYMTRCHDIFPQYGFNTHVGYGTKKHQVAIKEHGACSLHRASFRPFHEVSDAPATAKRPQTAGAKAEAAAATYLLRHGYVIIDQNWKTKWCEIDLIVQKNDRIYFVEVKYRQDHRFGHGLDYITSKKQNQMKFAAQLWCQAQHYTGPHQLSAIELIGPHFEICRWEPLV